MNENFFNILRSHGLAIALMLAGLYFINAKLDVAESRITILENLLYDCYEKRIDVADDGNILLLRSNFHGKLVGILPDEVEVPKRPNKLS